MLALQTFFPAEQPVADAPANDEAAVAQPDDFESDEPSLEGGDNSDASKIVRKSIDPEIEIKSNSEIEEMVAGEVAKSADINAYLAQRSLTSVRQMGDLLTIGSLDASGKSRYLITLNPYGGTVRRIELNVRKKKTGEYKYRDLEWNGGYLGSIEAHDTAKGVRVGVVGPGTPAADAGILKGDILVSMDDEPIVSADEFGRMMAVTEAGETIKIVGKRGDESQTFNVELTSKPIELVRPEPGILDPVAVFDESFLLKLYLPSDNPQVDWIDIAPMIDQCQWEVTSADDNSVEMKFQLSPAVLKEHGLTGPIYAVKRFTLPELAEEDIYRVDSKSYDWDLDIEIINESDVEQQIGYELKGPTGTPSETWWYSQKTHGRAAALFKIAGARDVLASTNYQDFNFWGGPEIVKDSLEENPKTKFFSDPFALAERPEKGQINWLGVDTLYFNVSLFPKKEEGQTFDVFSAFADITGGKVPENVREQKLVDCTFRMFKSISVPAKGSKQQAFEIFSGPKEKNLLSQYELDDTLVFGWFWWCSKPLLWLLHVFYVMTFKISYAIPIIILTILVRSIMIPFSRRAALNAQMMQYLQPQMKEIADKYKDNMEMRAKAQQDLFKKHNYKPLGGCFMGLIQLPIFIGLYRGLSLDIALRDQPLIPGISWCSNLSGPDQFWYWKDMWPSWLGEAGWFGPFLNILPLVTMVLFLVQQKMFTPPAMDEQQKIMQKSMSFMMLFMAVMFFKVPAGLCVYFVTSSIWAILEKKLLPKPVLDTSKLEAEDNADSGKKSLTERGMGFINRGKVDPAQKAREEVELRKQRNKDRKKQLKGKGKKK
jgi:YidC/Oxa1 family membrane protein insertase